jgi:hypothetical protein
MFLITNIISLEALSQMGNCRQVNTECSDPRIRIHKHKVIRIYFLSLSLPPFTRPESSHLRIATFPESAGGSRDCLNARPALPGRAWQTLNPLNCSGPTGEIPQSRSGRCCIVTEGTRKGHRHQLRVIEGHIDWIPGDGAEPEAQGKVEEPVAAPVDAGKQAGASLDTIGSTRLTRRGYEGVLLLLRARCPRRGNDGLKHFEEALAVPPGAPFNIFRMY